MHLKVETYALCNRSHTSEVDFGDILSRRRMERKAKAKVVASVWGRIALAIPCRASCFASVDLEENVEFILFFQIDRGKIASAARNWINSSPPPNRRDNLCLCFCLYPGIYAFTLNRRRVFWCVRTWPCQFKMRSFIIIKPVSCHIPKTNPNLCLSRLKRIQRNIFRFLCKSR